MLIQIILFLLLGIIAGTFTGLIPGIHINLISVFLISFSTTFFFSINPIYLVVFVSSMAITHTFLDFIPSIFLGCPDTDTELSILPGHEMLKQGRGYEAIILTNYGSLAAILILVLIAFPSIFIISKTYNFIKEFIPYLLILASFLLISLEKRKVQALFVFLLAGLLGFLTLNMEIKEPLLPLLTGLFGSSMLILSIKNKTQIPQQIISVSREKIFKPLLGAVIASPLCSFLPGLGSGQAAVIGNLISRTNRKGFLTLLGATNTLVMGFSFISLYVISKTRTGAAAAVQQLIGILSWKVFILILFTVIISGIISFYLTFFLAEFFAKRLHKINYTKLSIATIVLLCILIFAVSGPIGFIVLIASTLTGIFAISLDIKRTNMMGCLLIPTILLYFL